jgi:hypothetical protein
MGRKERKISIDAKNCGAGKERFEGAAKSADFSLAMNAKTSS